MISLLPEPSITFSFGSDYEERDVIASYRNFSERHLRCLLN